MGSACGRVRTVSRSESLGRGGGPQIRPFSTYTLYSYLEQDARNIFPGLLAWKSCKKGTKCDFGISGWKSLTRPYVFDVVFGIFHFSHLFLRNVIIFGDRIFGNASFLRWKCSKLRIRDFRVKIVDASLRFRRRFLDLSFFKCLLPKLRLFGHAQSWNSTFWRSKCSKLRFRDFQLKIADASPCFRRRFQELFFSIFS